MIYLHKLYFFSQSSQCFIKWLMEFAVVTEIRDYALDQQQEFFAVIGDQSTAIAKCLIC